MDEQSIKSEQEIGPNTRREARPLIWGVIPVLLGMGASVWLGTWIQGHNFKRQLSQEDRAAIYVGAAERPKSKIKILAVGHSCIAVTRVEFDGSSLLIYGQNNCRKSLDYTAWHWQLVSPDNTVLRDGMENGCPIPIQPGQKSECAINLTKYGETVDDRAATLQVFVKPDTF